MRIALAALTALIGSHAFGAEPTLRAGAFAMDVTPEKFPVSVNGGFADRKATSAHDPLHARCLVLDNGETRVALVVCDLLGAAREVFDEARRLVTEETGLPGALDSSEPAYVAEATRKLGLQHLVITSVDRDDLADGDLRLPAGACDQFLGKGPGHALILDGEGDQRDMSGEIRDGIDRPTV